MSSFFPLRLNCHPNSTTVRQLHLQQRGILQHANPADLRYSVLEYMYSSAAISQEWDTRLMGISLDLPQAYLNDTVPFVPPTKKDAPLPSPPPLDDIPAPPPTPPSDGPTPFLWQAPSSNAILFSGSKWVELHGFVSRLLDAQHRLPSTPSSFLSSKTVSKKFPSWLEHALRLARARGYWTLYPADTPAAGRFAVVHADLYKAPEEYEDEHDEEGELLPSPASAEGRGPQGQEMLARELVPGGHHPLPPFREMPLLSWDGRVVALEELDRGAAGYTTEFREAVGGCEDLEGSQLLAKADAADLFCEGE